MKSIFLFFWETIKVVVIALLIVIPIRYFLFQPFIVSGHSMEPNYSNGDYLIVEGVSYRIRDPQRGEVVVFHYPENPSTRHIKRIIGLPGEKITIDDSEIKITLPEGDFFSLDESEYLSFLNTTGKTEITLEKGEYFVMGDNRSASFDSRRWGSLPREYIIGKTALKVFPFADFKITSVPNYQY